MSYAIQAKNISHAEFHEIMQVMEKYRKLKEMICRQNKAKVRQIAKQQSDELLEQERKKGREEFLQKIVGTFRTQVANVI